VTGLEAKLGCLLAPQKRGPKPKAWTDEQPALRLFDG
jgi:hypothetical protein